LENLMCESHLEVLRQLLHSHGYALAEGALAEGCAHHPDEVCALLSAAGAIAATDAQIAALTDAANLLCEVYANGCTGGVLALRERLDRVADALNTALARRDKASAALRRTCETLTHTEIALVTATGAAGSAGRSGATPAAT
jgi:hypothetical protein